MSQLRESRTYTARPLPDEAVLAERRPSRGPAILRTLGAIAVLVVGGVHLHQYFVNYFRVVPIIGPLFLLNFVGATVIGLGLLAPAARLRSVHLLFALGGIGLAATSFVFLFLSEHQPVFGFQDYGYRPAIMIALATEVAAVVTLGAYLATRVRGKA